MKGCMSDDDEGYCMSDDEKGNICVHVQVLVFDVVM